MTSVVYDAGALIAAERNDRRMWAEHRVRLELGLAVAVPAPVVAQVSRSAKQAQLRRVLAGCEVVEFDEANAHAAGRILASSKTHDVVDAAVVELAIRRRATIVTSDVRDLSKLATAAGARPRIMQI
jgi:predicted nucleic acid-binding protein